MSGVARGDALRVARLEGHFARTVRGMLSISTLIGRATTDRAGAHPYHTSHPASLFSSARHAAALPYLADLLDT